MKHETLKPNINIVHSMVLVNNNNEVEDIEKGKGSKSGFQIPENGPKLVLVGVGGTIQYIFSWVLACGV